MNNTTPTAPVTLTWYRCAQASRAGIRINFEGDELAANIAGAVPHHGPKGELPLLCLATFEGEHRGNARVELVYMLGLDIDEPQADPGAYVARIAAALGGVEIFAYSTSSSSPGAFKLRALIPYDRPATADEHRASWALVARTLGREGIEIDRACCDPARGFYIWAVPANGAYFHAHLPGVAWPVGLAAEAEIARRSEEEAERQRELEARAKLPKRAGHVDPFDRARRYVARMPIAIQGTNGSDATFNVARKLVADFGLSDADAMVLLREHSARCRPPWSERELLHKLASAKQARVRVRMDP